jgi:acetylornithine/succinyldiaminopimelate/putrescine aminotransferase
MLSVEMENSETNFQVIKDCMENGLITDWFLFNDRSLRIAPPLIIDEKTIIKACRKITTALDRT